MKSDQRKPKTIRSSSSQMAKENFRNSLKGQGHE